MALGFFGALKGVLGSNMLELSGLYLLIALLPLILVYLIRPRPQKKKIPALMFFMKERTKSDKRSFFRWFIRDYLFLLQILIILVFAVTAAKPFMTVSEEVFVDKTAIIIDVSASMHTDIGGETRFKNAVSLAKKYLSDKNTIIVAGAIPALIGDSLSKGDAERELNRLQPVDTTTSLFDAIIFSGNYVKSKDRVVVVSDFIETGSNKDIKTAKSIIESRGVIVDFVNVLEGAKTAKNIGIVDLEIQSEKTRIHIKNYNYKNETVGLKLEGANLTKNSIIIGSGDREVVEIDTPAGVSKFELKLNKDQDNFKIDNIVYISAPKKMDVYSLIISNTVNEFLKTALDVIPEVKFESTTPPRFPDFNHHLIFFDDVKKSLVLPGTIKKLKKEVENGATLIIMASNDLLQIDFYDMLPVIPKKTKNVFVKKDVVVSSATPSTLTEDVTFGYIHNYFDVKAADGATVIAQTPDKVPIIVLKTLGKGMVVYYGIFDSDSDFKRDIYYPIFWKRLIDFAIKKSDLNKLNYKTGKIVVLNGKQKVETPKGKLTDNSIFLDKAGLYVTDEKTFVANLLNEEESDINGKLEGKKKGVVGEVLKKIEKVKFDLTTYFLIALAMLVFIELLVLKFRGDL